MATRTQKIALGIFMLGSVSLLIITLVALGAISFFDSPKEYFVRFRDSVNGLELGAPVKLRGVKIGRVTDIRLPNREVEAVLVWIEVDEHVPVKTDARALLKLQGITGLKFLELQSGTNQAPDLPKFSEIPSGKSALDRVSDRAEQLADRAEKLMQVLTEIDWAQSLRRIDTVLEISERIMLKLEKHVDAVGGETRTLIGETRANTKELFATAQNSMQKVDTAAERVERMTGQAEALFVSARHVVEETRGVVELGKGDVKNSLANLRQASASLKELVQAIRLQPSSLLFDKPQPERRR